MVVVVCEELGLVVTFARELFDPPCCRFVLLGAVCAAYLRVGDVSGEGMCEAELRLAVIGRPHPLQELFRSTVKQLFGLP